MEILGFLPWAFSLDKHHQESFKKINKTPFRSEQMEEEKKQQ